MLIGCVTSSLGNPANGVVSVKGTKNITLSYSCNMGYALIGEASRTCNESSEWSNDAPVCSRKEYELQCILVTA